MTAATETVLFMSKAPSTLVAFEEIRKETKDGYHTWKLEKFVRSRLEIESGKDYGPKRGKGAGIIKRLRKHIGNRSNNGTVFWEVDRNALDVMDLTAGKLVAREPSGGVDNALDKRLEALYEAIKGYDSDAHGDVVKETCDMFDLFTVMGLPKPEEDYDSMRLKARLIEFFSILKEREIWEALES